MASVNKVIIVGNLGRDPEIRTLASGGAVVTIFVATTYKSRDRGSGEQRELTEWHRIALFGRQAEIGCQYLKKGSSIFIEGRLQTRKYSDKAGVDRYGIEIIAEEMQMLGASGAKRHETADPRTGQAGQARSPEPACSAGLEDKTVTAGITAA